MLDNSWKRWVGENKLLGIPDQQIINTMKGSGISEQTAREELQAAATSPYYMAANYYTQLLHKRQSLAMIERQLLRLDPKHRTIERKSNVSRADFLEHHYSKGRPVILCGLMENWKAMTRWTPDYFKKTCGDTMVIISTERDKNPNYEMEDDQHRKRMKFSEYVDMVESAGETNDFYMTARGDFFKDPVKNPEVKQMFDDIEMFPEYLDPAVKSCNMWYGPKGTYTPIHHDTMNIFMAQVQGHKHIRMIPAAEMDLVYNDDGVYSPIDLRNPDYNKYPKLSEVSMLELDLVPGEVLFIPVGWWHDVHSLEKSVTVSFTNFVFPNEFKWVNPKRNRPVESTAAQPAVVMSAVNEDWMKWLDENFRRGCDPMGMVEIMEKSGFSVDAIRQAMGARFPARYGMAKPAEAKPVVDHKALAEIPVAQMEWHPGFKRIENGKLQLYTIDNFLTDAECDALVDLVDPNVRPSTITVYVEGYRTSYTSDLVNLKSPLVEAMEKKIAMAIGIRPAHSEGIQAQRYDVGQEFKSHTDYFEPFTEEYKIHAGKMGNRTWTFMVYLNDCPKGGGTSFVNLDQIFYPKKGQAVVWNNLYPNGKPNLDSMHWGMPVEEGRKYIITKWFRELGEGPMFYNETAQS